MRSDTIWTSDNELYNNLFLSTKILGNHLFLVKENLPRNKVTSAGKEPIEGRIILIIEWKTKIQYIQHYFQNSVLYEVCLQTFLSTSL